MAPEQRIVLRFAVMDARRETALGIRAEGPDFDDDPREVLFREARDDHRRLLAYYLSEARR